MKYFLTIAASDNSGGAGIQQDIKVAWDLGYWPLSAITGITVQNFTRARIIKPVDQELVFEQISESLGSFPVAAVKIGALTGEENLRTVSMALKKFKPSIVVLDPVIATSSGRTFLPETAISLLVSDLLPQVTVVTPNAIEFSIMTGKKATGFDEAVEIAKNKSQEWGTSIILKGGHFDGEDIREAIITQGSVKIFERKRLDFSRYSHGTGCTFSSALACYLADGLDLEAAYRKATDYLVGFYQRMQEEVGKEA